MQTHSLHPPSATSLLEKVAASPDFARSKRHAALLEFLVSQPAADLKETVVGHRFFTRPADYDPKTDPVVRVEMRRLRERLDAFYAGEGATDPWRLEIPNGAYSVVVTRAPCAPPPAAITVDAVVNRVRSSPPLVAQGEAAPLTAVHAPRRSYSFLWLALGLTAIVCLGVMAVAVNARGSSVWFAPRVRSMAVLPIESAGGETSSDLTIGLEQDLASALAQVDGLLVVGPAAARRARLASSDLQQIARDLQVDAVMSLSIAQSGSRVRLRTQVTRGSDGALLWAQSDERDLVDTFTLQNELASRVAAAVHLRLLRPPTAVSRAGSPEAVLDYRRGLQHIDRRNAASILQGIEAFTSATARDPDYAAAWAALAEAYAMLPDYVPGTPDWADRARAAGRHALALDPENPDALAALGWVDFQRDLRVGDALRLLNRALAANPNHLTAQRRIGLLLMDLGRFQEAEQHLRTALRLDPLAAIARINLAELSYAQRDWPTQERELRVVLDADPSYALGRVMLAVNYSMTNRCEQASTIAMNLLGDAEGSGWWVSMAKLLARCGEMGPARRMFESDTPAGSTAELAALFGDWPKALGHIQRIAASSPVEAWLIATGTDRALYEQSPEIRAIFADLIARVQRAQ